MRNSTGHTTYLIGRLLELLGEVRRLIYTYRCGCQQEYWQGGACLIYGDDETRRYEAFVEFWNLAAMLWSNAALMLLNFIV